DSAAVESRRGGHGILHKIGTSFRKRRVKRRRQRSSRLHVFDLRPLRQVAQLLQWHHGGERTVDNPGPAPILQIVGNGILVQQYQNPLIEVRCGWRRGFFKRNGGGNKRAAQVQPQ